MSDSISVLEFPTSRACKSAVKQNSDKLETAIKQYKLCYKKTLHCLECLIRFYDINCDF